MDIIQMIKREDMLRAMCASVYGPEQAAAQAQRLASRYEKDFREISGILVSMRKGVR